MMPQFDEIQRRGLAVRTVAEDGALAPRIGALSDSIWPRFVVEAHTPRDHPYPADWPGIFARWPQYQFGLLDQDTDELVGAAHALSFAWDGAGADLPDFGWDWAMWQGKQDYLAGATPHTMCALSITVDPRYRGQGLSTLLVSIMRDATARAGFTRLLAPVRPTLKHRYPITPMAVYANWRNQRGEPLDPWMRVHARLGATIAKPCDKSMNLAGSVADWESWAEIPFPTSGAYIFPGLFAPVVIDRESDEGVYVEPNVWMVHDVSA